MSEADENTDYQNKVETLHEVLKQKEEPESYLSQISVDPHKQVSYKKISESF